MFEAITALAILILAVFFVRTFYGPPALEASASTSQLEVIGDDILRTMDDDFPNITGNHADYHNSFLVWCIVNNKTEDFTYFVNNILTSTVLYNIYIYNASADSIYLWYPTDALPVIGNVVKSSRSFVYNGYVYDVQLEVWYI